MKKLKPYLRGLVLIATLVAIGYLVQVTGLRGLFDESWIDSQVRGQGISGELLFLGVGVVLTAIGFPRQAVCFLAGYAFGFALGMPLALAASLGGCILAFVYARLLGRSFVLARFPARIKRIDDFLHENPLSMTLLLRLLPVGSNLVANLAAGVSGVRALPFFAGSLLGYVPQTIIFVLLGSGIRLDPAWTTGVSVALFVVSSALGVYLFRRYRKSRALDADVAAALDETEVKS
ncbi:MAG TPA: VTT domain-containing protein [Alphaproteobacteria bacterium]|nr:VTT domain-containing protein [Alphaproteobacteria bacterium]